MRQPTDKDAQIQKLSEETANLIDALCERDELIREMIECLRGKNPERAPELIATAEKLIPKTSIWENSENDE